MIMTDGLVNDMESTIGSIINASNQPLSIIIIGVGSENFSGEDFALTVYSLQIMVSLLQE